MINSFKNRYDFFDGGIFIDPMVDRNSIISLLNKTRPILTNLNLIRVGAEGDGGYLIPDDLVGISECYSPGVDNIASFEADLVNFGILSHLADFSVEQVPGDIKVASFNKKFIGPNSINEFISLEDWINSSSSNNEDLILQMDIEGAEYASILSTSDNVLKRFRILAIEFHNIETWSQIQYYQIVESVFDKLSRNFYVVHNHPNNAMGIVNLGGVKVPRLMEITYIRKDRVDETYGFSKLPSKLDFPNVRNMPDIVIDFNQ